MIKIRHILLLALTLLLSSCKYAILDPKGTIAASEKHLFVVSILLMLTVVIPVIILSFWVAWRYRATNTKAKYTPDWSHSTLLESIWWFIPCVIILTLSIITWISTHDLDPYKPLKSKIKPIIIEAVALNWKWLFIYPKERIATINYIQIPVHVPIRFLITSDAPMNSLEIPQLAGQIYAMAGMRTKLNLMASEPGLYDGLSTNFSGDGFSDMTFKVRASSQKQYETWIKKVKTSPKKLNMVTYQQVAKNSENNPVEYFSSTSKGIFSMSIMKYMGASMSGMHLGYSYPKTAKINS